MKEGRILILIIVVVSVFTLENVTADCTTGTSNDDIAFGPTTTCTGTENTLPDDHSGQADFPGGGKVTYKGITYDMEPGGSITANDDGSITVNGGKEFVTEQGTELEDVETATVGSETETIEHAGRVQRDDVELRNTDNVELKPNGDFTADQAEAIAVGDITAQDATAIKRENGILSIGTARRIEVTDGILGTVENFVESEVGFNVESAKDIVIGCVSLRGVEQSHVSITPSNVVVQPYGDDVDFTISGCGFEQSSFQGNSEQSSISIPRTSGGPYEVTDAELTCYGPNANDKIETNLSSEIEYGDSCFSCMLLSPGGTYWYSDSDLIKDFALFVPVNGSQYQLCLRKQPSDSHSNYSGLVDFVNKRIKLDGIVTYRKVPSRDGEITSLLSEPVYQSYDLSNKAILQLDDGFFRISKLHIENSNPKTGILSFVNNGHYAVYEKSDGANVKRFGRFTEKYMPALIEIYESDFGIKTPTVNFSNDLLIQQGENAFGSQTTVHAVCDQCPEKSEFETNMIMQSKRYPVSAGRCGI